MTLETGVTATSDFGAAFWCNFARVMDHLTTKGTALSTHGKAILFQGQDSRIDVALGAQVTSTGLFAFSSSFVDLQNAGNSLFNQGTITSVSGPGVTTSGTDQSIGNSGLIEGGFAGVTMWGARSVVYNDGTIRNLAGDSNAAAVWIHYGGSQLDNSGTIASVGVNSAAVVLQGNQGAVGFIHNSGSITSAGGRGIESGVPIRNSGTIEGLFGAIQTSGGVLVNSGTINGEVRFLYGDDLYEGIGDPNSAPAGVVNGVINGGAGNDTYRIGVATAQIGELAREGFDTVEAQVSFALATAPNVEKLILGGTLAIDGWGSVANDVLIGNGQGNHLFGREGNDRIVGGANYLSGFGGGDVLGGGDSDDQVSGGFTGVGKLDTLPGGNRDDRLDGGNGQDLLTGGAGTDSFCSPGPVTAAAGRRGPTRSAISPAVWTGSACRGSTLTLRWPGIRSLPLSALRRLAGWRGRCVTLRRYWRRMSTATALPISSWSSPGRFQCWRGTSACRSGAGGRACDADGWLLGQICPYAFSRNTGHWNVTPHPLGAA